MNIVILAAGKGKRMRSLHPKVLQPLAGRPMLDHVLATVQSFSEKPSIVVVGHGADEVEARYADRSDIRFVLQAEQHGTGHALQVALDALDAEDPQTLVCLGDVPLLSCKTIAAMREECGLNDMVRNKDAVMGIDAASFSFGALGGATNINTFARDYAPGLRASIAYTNGNYYWNVTLDEYRRSNGLHRNETDSEVSTGEHLCVEGGCRYSRRLLGGHPFYGGMYVEDYKRDTTQFKRAVEMNLRESDGLMVFDIVHIIQRDWWGPLGRAIAAAEAEAAAAAKAGADAPESGATADSGR